jgi:hypothetical protein
MDWPTGGKPMQYLLLIYHSEAEWAKLTSAEQGPIYQEYIQLVQQLSETGKYRGGNALKPTGLATTVRVRDAKRLVTDGPFAETKEQLGGYFLVDANDLDEAITIAGRIPGARYGSIEVRPVVVREQAAGS